MDADGLPGADGVDEPVEAQSRRGSAADDHHSAVAQQQPRTSWDECMRRRRVGVTLGYGLWVMGIMAGSMARVWILGWGNCNDRFVYVYIYLYFDSFSPTERTGSPQTIHQSCHWSGCVGIDIGMEMIVCRSQWRPALILGWQHC